MNSLKNNYNTTTVIILCTLPNNQVLASKIIKILLSSKLAACITMFKKAYSSYYWDNKIKTHAELQLLIKTKKSFEKSVFKKIKEIHSYKIPELLTIPIISGELNYLKWIDSILK